MRIAILDLTTHPEPMLSGLPRVGAQIEAWLAPSLPEASFDCIDVAEAGSPMPPLDSFDGLLLSGSEYGVYDDLPWMGPLRQLLLDTKSAGKPIFGICFGHQMMADVFGGKADKADIGNIVGARAFDFKNSRVNAHVWHKDQVTKVPPGAKVTATAAHCPVGALSYDFPAASIQFHPEYTEPHLRELFRRGTGEIISKENAKAALSSFRGDVPVDLMAKETADFFRKVCS